MPAWLAAIAWVTPMKGACPPSPLPRRPLLQTLTAPRSSLLVAPASGATKIQFINELSGLRFDCDTASIASGRCVATSGDELLQAFGFSDLDTARFCGIMVATTVAWRVLAWACLQARMYNK